jgi:restriction system protein
MDRRWQRKDGALAIAIAGAMLLFVFVYSYQPRTIASWGAIFVMIGLTIAGIVFLIRPPTPAPRVIPDQISLQRGYFHSPPPASSRASSPDCIDLKDGHVVDPRVPTLYKAWTLELINELEWKRFEELCANYFRAKGYDARVTQSGANGAIDILLYEGSNSTAAGIVQCRAWSTKAVGIRSIRELLGVMADAAYPLGVFISTSGYTKKAEDFARRKRIKLLDVRKILELITALPEDKRHALLLLTTAGDYRTPVVPKLRNQAGTGNGSPRQG